MVRKASPQAVTAKMYRHFALITVGLTATLAIFADGENREAVATELEHVQTSAEKSARNQAAAEQRANAQFAQGDNYSSGEMDVGGSFGAPMDSPGLTGGSMNFVQSGGDGPARYGNLVPGGLSELGLAAEQLAQLSPAQKQAMLDRMRRERANAAAQMAEQSRLRSGSTGPSTDEP